MKKFLIFVNLVCFYCLFSFAQSDASINKQLPESELKDLKGNIIKTSSISNEGKPIIVSFWATWCKPCIKELTTIAEVYDDWQTETGVKLYAISIDDSRSSTNVKPLVDGKAWDYIVLLDMNGDFKRKMGVNMIPHTFLLDNNRNVVWQHTSFTDGGEKELIELVKKLATGEKIN